MARFPEGAQDITDAAALGQVVRQLDSVAEVAVDVEADAMHAFDARLCFVQLGTDEHVFLVDTLSPGVQAGALAPVFVDERRRKYLHAAGGDLQYLAEQGIRVKNLFDTHRAATLLGWPKVGLADLARERLGVTLLKEHQQSDFSLRPLPEAMRAYIADDVRYLCEIGRQVRQACVEADILEEVELDCQRMCDEAQQRPDLARLVPKVPRAGSPKDQRYREEAARALHLKRLEWAKAANVPMGRMLSNAAIAELAIAPAGMDLAKLKRIPNVRGPFVREHGQETLALLQELRQKADLGELPPPLAEDGQRDPGRRKREDKLREFRTAKALERKVTGSVVLPNPLVSALAAKPPRTLEELAAIPYFGEKRVRLYGAELLELLKKT